MTPAAAGALLSRADEIRSMLRELMHPQSRVNVRATAGQDDSHHCEARILGPDWQLRHFFWRPQDLDAFEAHLQAPSLDEIVLDFTGATPDGGDVRFRVARPLVMRFVDSSAAMLSAFPDVVWYQRAAPSADA